MRAVLVDSDDCLRVGIQFAGFIRIYGSVRTLPNLDETEGGARIHHSGIDTEAAAFNRLRTGRNVDARAHGIDLSITNHDRAILDVRSRERDDASIANGVGAARIRDAFLRGRTADLLREDTDKREKNNCQSPP